MSRNYFDIKEIVTISDNIDCNSLTKTDLFQIGVINFLKIFDNTINKENDAYKYIRKSINSFLDLMEFRYCWR
jgi:hypothetical protein